MLKLRLCSEVHDKMPSLNPRLVMLGVAVLHILWRHIFIVTCFRRTALSDMPALNTILRSDVRLQGSEPVPLRATDVPKASSANSVPYGIDLPHTEGCTFRNKTPCNPLCRKHLGALARAASRGIRRDQRGMQLGTCAVVSSSGRLRARSFGSEIDSHDVVIRLNFPPVRPEDRAHVGRKTDVILGGVSWNFTVNVGKQGLPAFLDSTRDMGTRRHFSYLGTGVCAKCRRKDLSCLDNCYAQYCGQCHQGQKKHDVQNSTPSDTCRSLPYITGIPAPKVDSKRSHY